MDNKQIRQMLGKVYFNDCMNIYSNIKCFLHLDTEKFIWFADLTLHQNLSITGCGGAAGGAGGLKRKNWRHKFNILWLIALLWSLSGFCSDPDKTIFTSRDFSSPYSIFQTPIKMFTSIAIKILRRENIDILSCSQATPRTTDFTGSIYQRWGTGWWWPWTGTEGTADIVRIFVSLSLQLLTISTLAWLETGGENWFHVLRVKASEASEARVPRTRLDLPCQTVTF